MWSSKRAASKCAGPFHEGGWGCAHLADESCYSKMLNNGIGNRLQHLKTVKGGEGRVPAVKRGPMSRLSTPEQRALAACLPAQLHDPF